MLIFRLRNTSTGSTLSAQKERGDADLEAATRNVVLEAFERFIGNRPKTDETKPEVLTETTAREIEATEALLTDMRNALIDALDGNLDRESVERLIDRADALLNL